MKSLLMNPLLKLAARFRFADLKRIAAVLLASAFMLVTTACSPADVDASSSAQPVPEASQADIERAQGNLSEEAVNEDVLSKQGPSRARQSNGVVSPQ